MLIGKELMDVLYKGRELPKVKGRYVDMGMSFKKGEAIQTALTIRRSAKRKPGELQEEVLQQVLPKWQSTKDIASRLSMTPEGVRNALERLVREGRIESNGIRSLKQYRRKQCKS
jgi:hypothetical protein